MEFKQTHYAKSNYVERATLGCPGAAHAGSAGTGIMMRSQILE
jgi:hypothetical protein